MIKAPRLLPACFVAITLGQTLGLCAPSGVTRTADCSLIDAPFERFSGETTSKDFFVQLPEHISVQPGSEVNLALRHSPQFEASAVTLSINGQKILSSHIDGNGRVGETDINTILRATVPQQNLNAGWNRISLEWSLPRAGNHEALRSAGWSIWKLDSRLRIVYQRLPLFSELARFPASVAEEKLLRQGGAASDSSTAVVAILVPTQRRDVHVRSAAILGARLGQLGYLADDDCHVGSLADWSKHTSERNGIVVGRWDELGDLPLVTNVAASLAALKEGQGLLAEFILGELEPRRWLLATGRDDAGVEKAALTLGSVRALAAAPPTPAVIETKPALPEELEIQKTGVQRIALKNMGWKKVQLRGRQSEKSVSGWLLPPGVEVATGSFFQVQLSHSKALTNSSLEVRINGIRAGSVSLTAENASPTPVKVFLPQKLLSRDPMVLTLRATMEASAADRSSEEEPWVSISGESTLETATEPIRITGLHQAHQFMIRDRFLRKAAFLVPQNLSLEELQVVCDLSMSLGRQFPSSPILWPEACTYSTARPPSVERLQGRSVLLLGSVPQWKAALPPRTRLAIGPPDGHADTIRIQGRRHKFSTFEPSLVFMQMVPSPWSSGDALVTLGGWKDFASRTVKQVLTEAAPSGRFYGNLAAMDAAGRTAAYDTRRPSVESFADRLQKRIPLGLNSEETDQKFEEEKERVRSSGRWNDLVFYFTGALLIFFVALRLLLLWDRERSREKSTRGEKPLGSMP